MGFLGIRFVVGPVGGGEVAPWRLRFGYGCRGLVADALRDLANLIIRADPILVLMYAKADRIYVRTPESRDVLPRRFRRKTACQLGLGIDAPADPGAGVGVGGELPLQILFVGRFLYWKGMHLGLRACAVLRDRDIPFHLTMVGQGPEERHWRGLARRLGLEARITWKGWLPHLEIGGAYRAAHVLLFPILHDSGGQVVLEAMSYGVPVVCVDLGGPGAIVTEGCGRRIAARGRRQAEVVRDLAGALCDIAWNAEERIRLGAGARRRSGEFAWSAVVRSVYGAPR
jgi:glycosyltransferase involved in cell wall biosynthesis